jgi:hypothetical protein
LTEPALTAPPALAESFSVTTAEEPSERTSPEGAAAVPTAAEATPPDGLPQVISRFVAPMAAMMMMTPTEPKTRCIKKHIVVVASDISGARGGASSAC